MQKDQGSKTDVQGEKSEPTRRRFLDKIFMTVAGGAVLMFAGTQSAEAKTSKAGAKYQSNSRGGSSCRNCLRYEGGGACSKVSGRVSSGGWCKFYTA